MTIEELTELLIDIETVNIALDDKIHKLMNVTNRNAIKIQEYKEQIKELKNETAIFKR